MQALRNSVYLIVAVGSIAMAACQPHDVSTDAAGHDVGHATRELVSQLDKGLAFSSVTDVGHQQ